MEERNPSSSSSVALPATSIPAPPTSLSSTDQKPANSTPHDSSTPSASTSASGTTKKTLPKRATSAANSPLPSRESSPVRPPLKQNSSSTRSSGAGRSRKNSVHDLSPSRTANNTTNPPSAAATQRALSAASTPSLHPASSEPPLRAPAPQKTPATSEIKETPRWPVSPRLRSPPPINKHSIAQPRKTEQDTPTINVPRPSPGVDLQEARQTPTTTSDSEVEDSLSIPGMRTPARGASGSTLETVQEISLPNTPGPGLDGILDKSLNAMLMERDNALDNAFNKPLKSKGSTVANESGSESGGKGEVKMRSASAAPAVTPRTNGTGPKSFSAGTGMGRGKTSGDGTAKNMTVETETVSSIPQVAVGGVGGGNNGSLRTKPSSETIRPKKEKKKTTRKAPSVTSGAGEHLTLLRPKPHHRHYVKDAFVDTAFTRSPERQYGQGPCSPSESSCATSPERSTIPASRRPSLNYHSVSTLLTRLRPASSKADIFEAKVASAVDEANSTDSEETFVYESNPPENNDRSRRFHHSRTPSVTSMASQADQRNGGRSGMDGGHHSVAMKKSMKFANSYNSNAPEVAAAEDDGKGTARSNMGTGRGTTHHHHIGRWGRNGGNGHPSLFDTESPFPNVAKSKLAANGNGPRHSSQPTSPRMVTRLALNGKKASPISSGYDMEDGADDERTPLMSGPRGVRSNRIRRPASSMRQLEHQAARHNKSFLARFAGCLVLSIMIILVFTGAIGFMFATSQPLAEVKVIALKNILASEQEVILDMKVTARNPNLVAVNVDMADLDVFAKSKYAGTDSEWWQKPPRRGSGRGRNFRKRDDDPLDPPIDDDDPASSPNWQIGKVVELSSPLTFEGSPFHHAHSFSTGQIRISNPGNYPGNKTNEQGSERWERVLQHEFYLILRGTLDYTLPLSQKIRHVIVDVRVLVKPNAADQDPDNIDVLPKPTT